MSNSAQKEIIVQKLRERGCRITKQRLILLDIILEDEYSSEDALLHRPGVRFEDDEEGNDND